MSALLRNILEEEKKFASPTSETCERKTVCVTQNSRQSQPRLKPWYKFFSVIVQCLHITISLLRAVRQVTCVLFVSFLPWRCSGFAAFSFALSLLINSSLPHFTMSTRGASHRCVSIVSLLSARVSSFLQYSASL